MKRRIPKVNIRALDLANRYITKLFASEDARLKASLNASHRAGLPPISVSPAGGKLLYLLARTIKARRILEVGTLGGYSAIWLARALPPGGRLVTLELNPQHAAVAKRNIARAGFKKKVEVLIGPALKLMRQMIKSRLPLFDMVFIDADKEEYPGYLRLAYRLLRRGGLIVVDNALRRVVNSGDNRKNGVAKCNRLAARHQGLISLIVPEPGKGVDGILVCLKR